MVGVVVFREMLITLGIRDGGGDVHLQELVICRMLKNEICLYFFKQRHARPTRGVVVNGVVNIPVRNAQLPAQISSAGDGMPYFRAGQVGAGEYYTRFFYCNLKNSLRKDVVS